MRSPYFFSLILSLALLAAPAAAEPAKPETAAKSQASGDSEAKTAASKDTLDKKDAAQTDEDDQPEKAAEDKNAKTGEADAAAVEKKASEGSAGPEKTPSVETATDASDDSPQQQEDTAEAEPEPKPETEAAEALLKAIEDLPPIDSDEDRNERAAITAFYKARNYEPLYIAENGATERVIHAQAEFANADAWGLDPEAFEMVEVAAAKDGAPDLKHDTRAKAEITFARTLQLYVRYARGGRIIHPGGQLNSNLDRRPQFAKPEEVMADFEATSDAAGYLRGVHTHHAQFHKLRHRYLVAKGNPRKVSELPKGEELEPGQTDKRVMALRERFGITPGLSQPELYDEHLKKEVVFFQKDRGLERTDGVIDEETRRALNKNESASYERLRANMEQWRWMYDDLGDLHLIANIPEYMIDLYKDGKVIFSERIVVGELDKQTTIFTRPIRHIVLRPMWRVPESIKVKELWPSLRGSGGLMRQYGLQLETKDGRPLDWRKMDWYKEDIRNYEVVQPPGRKSVLGKVKYSFPSQHTIFMHDTPDKWMFRQKQRTLSHGCLRLRDPLKLAEILLNEDRGWDRAKIDELVKSGPLNNAVKLDKRVMIHMTYFTAWVSDDGKLKQYSDVYGHERRIKKALDGRWKQIAKGRNHLAPPKPNFTKKTRRARPKKDGSVADIIGNALGLTF